jgi:hypothetical protein
MSLKSGFLGLALVGLASLGLAPALQAQDPAPAPAAAPGIMQTAETRGYLEWAEGVRQAGLETQLDMQPYTVFVAEDPAYQQLPAETREQWRADPLRLRAAAGHGIVEGRLTADDLRQRGYVTTIDGQRLEVRTVGDQLMIGDATIVEQNIDAGPGLIHRVDRVLLPAEQPVDPQPVQPIDPTPAEPVEPAPVEPAPPLEPQPVEPAPVREPVRKDW